MKEQEIREMLNGIINNGEKWEYRCSKQECCSDCNYSCVENKIWQPYKLGEGILKDWEYRKVVKGDMKEHTKKTWLEDYLYQCTIYEGERIASKSAIEDVCKKILEEVDKKVVFKDFENYESGIALCISLDNLEYIIKGLGIEL